MNCKKYEIICEANRHWLKIIYLYKNSHVFPVHYCTVDCYSLHLTSPVPVQATTTSQEDYTPHFLPHAFAVPSPMRDGVYFPILVMLVLTTWLISANGNIKKASCVSTCPLMLHSSPDGHPPICSLVLGERWKRGEAELPGLFKSIESYVEPSQLI